MKRFVLGAVALLSLLYGAPAQADAPTVDLATAPAGPDTAVPFIELVGTQIYAAHAVYRLTAGAQTITFKRPFTGADPNGADTDMTLLGGRPSAWLVQDDVPHYVGGRTGYESVPKLYRLAPDGRLAHLTDPPTGAQVTADARFYAVLPDHSNTVSVYRIATGRLVGRRTFADRGYHRLGPLVGNRLVVNVRQHATLWTVGRRTARRLPGVVQAMAGNTLVLQGGAAGRSCSRVASVSAPRRTLSTMCGFESLSPDGQHIVTIEGYPRFGLRDLAGNLLAYYDNAGGVFGWSDGSTVSFSVDGTDATHPYAVATCTLASCHQGPGHVNYLNRES